jgi:hypothetical protein
MGNRSLKSRMARKAVLRAGLLMRSVQGAAMEVRLLSAREALP